MLSNAFSIRIGYTFPGKCRPKIEKNIKDQQQVNGINNEIGTGFCDVLKC